MNRKSKIVLFFLLLLAGGAIIYMCFRQEKSISSFNNRLKEYTRRIERLNQERDSLYRALTLRERQYRHVTDSLNAAMIKIQTRQTQNYTQYEIRRDSITLLPDDERYRFVTGYIERYGSRLER